ncbi:hypothetical protein DL764_007212 [Monosporascus ibericus]|uniref:Uncharacterized protein n=1 Tax=Monosporascus ibericus TaxID=155417 RepID=A0A4V1X9V1_9PEZI|nr:hypothetical protein DL764_007212 [Monosporascus ibericus]
MFRLFRSRPNIMSLGRRVNGISLSHTPSPEIIRLQRVKVRRKWFKPMNFVIAGGIYYGCYRVYMSTIFGTLNQWLDESEAQLSEKERKELEEDIEPFFIPLPFTTKQVEPLPYRGSDPEWQTFIKISKNPTLLRDIESKLATICRMALEAHPGVMHKYGKDPKVVKYMIDIVFPSKPPPTFVRKGFAPPPFSPMSPRKLTCSRIAIDEEGISIEEHPVSSLDVFRVRRILWPSALAMSLWSFTGALMRQNATAAAKALGYEPKQQPTMTMQQTMERIHQQLQKPQPKTDSKAPSSLPSTKSQVFQGSSADPTSPGAPASTGSSPAGVGGPLPAAPNAAAGKQKSAREIYGVKMAQEHTNGPWRAFKQRLVQTWRPLRDYPPRGSISVSGVVELDTPRARITVEAFAWWDPKTQKFDGRSLVLRWRSIRPKTQNPLR